MEALSALSEWPVAEALRRHGTAYLLMNAAHILSFGALIGSILTLDLRILGLFGGVPLAALAPPLIRVAGWGLGLALVTGFMLFSVRPLSYVQNPAFLAKLALLVLGIANVAVVHFGRRWKAALSGSRIAGVLRGSALVSILIWAGAVVAGRWIGFL
jgi:hypothetical protein